MRNAVIVSAARTAVGKAPKGSLRTTRPDDMAAVVINEVIARAGIDPAEIEDVALGCAFPEAEQGMNVARIAVLRAGLPETVCGQTINRFCSSGVQSIAIAAQQIMAGMGDVIIAGGVESMSHVPMIGNKFVANPTLAAEHPGAYIGMGLTAENVARQFNISREDQDAFALRSHQRAAAAQDAGKFDAEIVPLEVNVKLGNGSQVSEQSFVFDKDEGIRRETIAGSAGQAAHGLPCQGHGHRGQRQPDQRRRGRRADHERGTGQGSGSYADGPLCELWRRRRGARVDGHRPDRGRAQGAEVCRHGSQ